MSIALHSRIKELEARIAALEAAFKELMAEPEKPKRGRPAKDANGQQQQITSGD